MSKSARMAALAGLFAVGLVCGSGLQPSAPAQDKGKPPVAGPRWDYKVVTEGLGAEAKQTEAVLKPLGEDGWELVTATHVPLPGGAGTTRYVLKRPKR